MSRSKYFQGISTPFKKTPSYKSKRTRIRIPQPIDRPLRDVGKDLLKEEEMPGLPDWFTYHRRPSGMPSVGGNVLEARAVPRTEIRGYLHERIVYKFLRDRLYLQPGVDFDYQSSQLGGRLELGGIVADFLFPILKIIIQVEGPTHDTHLRQQKDREQEDILADMGYTIYRIPIRIIRNEYVFEDMMRRIFNLHGGSGQSSGMTDEDDITNNEIPLTTTEMVWLMAQVQDVLDTVESIGF